MSKSQPLVSVITPVYNGEKFLRNSIESVLNQTYTNWVYTIVNNHSKDRSLEIAEEYAAKDSRISVTTADEFVPVIASFNNAFRTVSPDSVYCKPVGADDLLLPECLEKMVALAEANPSVGLVGAYGLTGPEVVWKGLTYPREVIPGRELGRSHLLAEYYVFGTPTTVMFRSEMVLSKPAFFNEDNIHADMEACLRIMTTHDFGFVFQVLTTQGVQDDSVTSGSNRIQSYFPAFLRDLDEFGLTFLSERELEKRRRELLHDYYWYLAMQVFKRREPSFWKYHSDLLQTLGMPLSKRRLAKYMLAIGLDHGLNPKAAMGKAARMLGVLP